MSDIPPESFKILTDNMSKLFIEIAVSEEKLSNKVTGEQLQKDLRIFEKELDKMIKDKVDELKVELNEIKKLQRTSEGDLYKYVDSKMTSVSTKFNGYDDKFSDIKSKVTRNSVIVSMVISIIVAIVVSFTR